MGLLKPIRIDENRRRLPLAGTNQKIWGVTVNGVGARERDRVLTASASSGPSECPCLIVVVLIGRGVLCPKPFLRNGFGLF